MVKKTTKSKMRKKIPKEIIAKLMVESRRTCNLCWIKKAAHVHHIIPTSKGGDDTEDNLILLCNECHPEAHTISSMARNLNPETLRLYKATWIDLIKKYPLIQKDIIEHTNDIKIIEGILIHADRRSLYFPLNVKVGYRMFKSLDELREYIQKSGYRLLRNENAKEHIHQMYKSLCEIEFLNPGKWDNNYCLYGLLGRKCAEFLELRRKTICFHLNDLAKMIGHPNGIFAEDEFKKMDLEIKNPEYPENAPPCFARYSKYNSLCQKCEYAIQCQKCTM